MIAAGSARWGTSGALALSLLFAAPGWADEPKVEVNAEVVLMSNQGDAVDPSLVAMKDTFTKEGLSFTSYRRLSNQRISLEPKKPAELDLPANKKATLKLQSIKEGTATVGVSIPGAVNATYTLGRHGSVFINFGKQNGELVLVLSPAATRRPRNAGRVLRPSGGAAHWLWMARSSR